MAYIRKTYGVPAKRGGRVEYTSAENKRLGTICGSKSQYLKVRLDGDKWSKLFHPTFDLRYLPEQLPPQQESKT